MRAARLQRLEDLGYQLLRLEGTVRAYALRAPDGTLLDNHGTGYASTVEALTAALRHGQRPANKTLPTPTAEVPETLEV
jgi:hypothetical protein